MADLSTGSAGSRTPTRSPASPGMISGRNPGSNSPIRVEDLQRTMSKFTSRTADRPGINRELDFDISSEITVDGKELFELLDRFTDKGLANTNLTELFDSTTGRRAQAYLPKSNRLHTPVFCGSMYLSDYW